MCINTALSTAAALGAATAVDMHRPDRPQYSLARLFGLEGTRLQGFLQGEPVPRPLPGFQGDVMPGQMRPPVVGAAPGMIMPQPSQ